MLARLHWSKFCPSDFSNLAVLRRRCRLGFRDMRSVLIALLVGQATALRVPAAALRPAFAARPAVTARRTPPPRALSPSGIDGLSLTEQAQAVAGIMVALGVGSVAVTAAFEAIGEALPVGWGTSAVKGTSLLGGAFMAAGYAHFALPAAYEAIFPPPGTWGWWYLPGSASFHIAWTGAAECIGGAGLLAGGALDALGVSLGDRARPLRQVSPDLSPDLSQPAPDPRP